MHENERYTTGIGYETSETGLLVVDVSKDGKHARSSRRHHHQPPRQAGRSLREVEGSSTVEHGALDLSRQDFLVRVIRHLEVLRSFRVSELVPICQAVNDH